IDSTAHGHGDAANNDNMAASPGNYFDKIRKVRCRGGIQKAAQCVRSYGSKARERSARLPPCATQLAIAPGAARWSAANTRAALRDLHRMLVPWREQQ